MNRVIIFLWKLYSLPYRICWNIIIISLLLSKHMKLIIQKILNKEDVEKYVWDLISEYDISIDKFKPHIIGIFWISILLLIFK